MEFPFYTPLMSGTAGGTPEVETTVHVWEAMARPMKAQYFWGPGNVHCTINEPWSVNNMVSHTWLRTIGTMPSIPSGCKQMP